MKQVHLRVKWVPTVVNANNKEGSIYANPREVCWTALSGFHTPVAQHVWRVKQTFSTLDTFRNCLLHDDDVSNWRRLASSSFERTVAEMNEWFELTLQRTVPALPLIMPSACCSPVKALSAVRGADAWWRANTSLILRHWGRLFPSMQTMTLHAAQLIFNSPLLG